MKKNTGNKDSVKKKEIIDKEDANVHLKTIVDNIDHEFLWSSPSLFDSEKTFYSKGVVDVTGYSEKEIMNLSGRGFFLIVDEDKELIKKKLDKFINDKSCNNIKLVYRIKTKNGNKIWVKENITVKRNKKGTAEYFYGTISDITELKEAEEKIRESENKLKKLNDSKDKFISILSHDLRSPFTSILGFSEILMSEPNLSEAERTEYLTYINDSSQNQLQLINYLLDWSRLQTGRIKIEAKRLQTQSVVFNCISSLTGNAIRKNIEIKVNVDENIYVNADERLLTQVVTNLISNAIKFSTENKTIEVSADTFNSNLVEFIITDQGIGIPERNQTKLFLIDQMFTTEGTKGEKGTGLGLPLVKEIVEKHGGNIWFYSKVNEGSEFHITIPSAKNNIYLINEDEKENKLIEEIMSEVISSFNIFKFSDGYNAINKMDNELPSLIILNHKIPLMNGIKFLETLIKSHKKFNTPVIVLSDEITAVIKNSYKDIGVDAIVQKPIKNQKFKEIVEEILK